MKKIIFVFVLFLTQTASAKDFSCQKIFEDDMKYLKHLKERTSFAEVLLKEVPKACFSKDGNQLAENLEERIYACGITASIPAFLAYFPQPFGILGATGIFLIADHKRSEARWQYMLEEKIHRYYTAENTEKILEEIKIDHFRQYTVNKEVIRDILENWRSGRELCPNKIEMKESFRLTQSGVEYLQERGYDQSDLVFDDSMPESLRNYVAKQFVRRELQPYGGPITPRQFKELVRQEMDARGYRRHPRR